MRTVKVVGIGVVPPLDEPIYRPSPKNPPYNPNHRNFCVDCGEDFASVEVFDRHRLGLRSRRKCALVGLELDANGRWDAPRNADIRSQTPGKALAELLSLPVETAAKRRGIARRASFSSACAASRR